MGALHGKSMEVISQYIDMITNTSIKSLDRLGVLGILLTITAMWFKNMEKTGGETWKPNTRTYKIGLFIRRTANDVLLSVFGIGATVAGLFITLAWLMKGSPREWLIFGLTVTQFSIIIGMIGVFNFALRVDDSSRFISWQQKLHPVFATLIYLTTGIALAVTITQ